MLDASGGLPENNVRDMLMLPDGLMCIQTTSYLCFFDGAACLPLGPRPGSLRGVQRAEPARL